MSASAFADVEAVYEKFGADNPFYAVLSLDEYHADDRDEARFFQTGEELIDQQLQAIEDRGIRLNKSRALDFGCGVGRLTNALARHFDNVLGVDVSSTMVATANQRRRHSNCSFAINKRQDLSAFEGQQFDFIYSDITIQHIPSPASQNYIQDFCRLLSPGGLAVFLIPDGPAFQPNSLGARLDRFNREQVRPFFKRIRGKHEVQIHRLARERVETLVAQAGGTVVHVEPLPRLQGSSRRYKPLYYWVTKE